jgi:hypothetical protein
MELDAATQRESAEFHSIRLGVRFLTTDSEHHDTQNDHRICRGGSDCRGSISDGRIRSNLPMG